MTVRSPAGPLMHEHRLIERMIAVLRNELESIANGGRIDWRMIDSATDFIRTYADRCHHGKEEDILFDRLASKELDPELAREMQDLIDDHVRARTLTGSLVTANARYADGDSSALSEIESALRALIDLYPVHIEKEDRHFFKPCLEYFDEDEKAQMLLDFDEFEMTLLHDKYRQLVEGLEARAH